MKTTITSAGMVTNELGPSANPHECHDFQYTVTYTEDSTATITHLRWYADNLPLGLSIDEETGLITGNIHPLHLQPDCADNLQPDLPMDIGGSNKDSMGLYNGSTHTFDITIYREYEVVLLATPSLDPEVEVAESNIQIMVIKSGNIFNTVFVKKQLDMPPMELELLKVLNESTTLTVEVHDAHLVYNSKKYFKDDIQDFYMDHPGPFSKCKNDI